VNAGQIEPISSGPVNAGVNKRTRLPLAFGSVQDELNFMGLRSMLDFGRGYEDLLVQDTKRTFDEVVLFGMINLHISGTKLDVAFMKQVNPLSISNHFGFSIGKDEEIMTGVYKMVDGPLKVYAGLMVQCLNETATKLESLGFNSFGEFLYDYLNGKTVTAQEFVQHLSNNFDAFKDQTKMGDNRMLYFCRKATILAGDIYDRFIAVQEDGSQDKGLSDCFQDIRSIGIKVDAELINALLRAEILPATTFPTTKLELDRDIAVETQLRVKSFDVCNDILQNVSINPWQLDEYLRATFLEVSPESPTTKLEVVNSTNY